jgi:hypothetical protein
MIISRNALETALQQRGMFNYDIAEKDGELGFYLISVSVRRGPDGYQTNLSPWKPAKTAIEATSWRNIIGVS